VLDLDGQLTILQHQAGKLSSMIVVKALVGDVRIVYLGKYTAYQS